MKAYDKNMNEVEVTAKSTKIHEVFWKNTDVMYITTIVGSQEFCFCRDQFKTEIEFNKI